MSSEDSSAFNSNTFNPLLEEDNELHKFNLFETEIQDIDVFLGKVKQEDPFEQSEVFPSSSESAKPEEMVNPVEELKEPLVGSSVQECYSSECNLHKRQRTEMHSEAQISSPVTKRSNIKSTDEDPSSSPNEKIRHLEE